MELCRDFRELLASFNARRVEYLIVGGYALAHHGAPRFTGDLDLYVHPTPENAERIFSALGDFGFGQAGLRVEDFQSPGQIIQLGHPPIRIDIITSLDGVAWEEAWASRDAAELQGLKAHFIGRREFIANKKACGRAKDIADVEALG
jgi:hypothetical protein